MKENSGINWVKLKVKMWCRRQIQYLPLWKDRDSEQEVDVDNHEEKRARVNMCSVKAFKQYLGQHKEPQTYVPFLRKVDKLAEEKVEGKQVPSDVHMIKKEDLPKEIWKICEEYVNIFPSNLPRGCHQKGWVMSSKLT